MKRRLGCLSATRRLAREEFESRRYLETAVAKKYTPRHTDAAATIARATYPRSHCTICTIYDVINKT